VFTVLTEKEGVVSRFVRCFIAIVPFTCISLAGAAQEDLPYTQQEHVVYAETHGTGLIGDIFVPTGKNNGLGIVDVVSGAWHSDSGKLRDHMLAQVYTTYCSRGYTVFAMRPGSVTKYNGEEMLENVKTAIRYVKSKAEEYKIDPDRLGLTGASAGGHLATLAAVRAEDGNPEAKDPLKKLDTRVKGVTDFLDWGGKEPNFSGPIGSLLFTGGTEGHSAEEIEIKARELSPRYQVKEGNLPTFLLIHGDADPSVPLQQSEVFVEAVKAAGGSAELIVKPGGAHPWPTINEEVAVMADWFDKTL
jgi:acetyl esterase/lipase